MTLKVEQQSRCWGGVQITFSHDSKSNDCRMRFAVFVPGVSSAAEALESKEQLPTLYFLSGLTCTEENFSTKAGAQKYAAEHNVVLVIPDTSPRGVNLPGEDERWDFGSSAGYYLNATQEPWSRHYKMYDYILKELTTAVSQELPIDKSRVGIMGHSMGGHGALVLGMRNSNLFRSISAFAPLCAPTKCDWGKNAFSNYLGPDPDAWKQYDSAELLTSNGYPRPLLVDQGSNDPFVSQLKPESLKAACESSGVALTLRYQEGYDHGYYFIQSFIGEHIEWHLRHLNNPES